MTDIPSWLQVGLATLSLGTAATACLSASKSAKAATQSDQTAGTMLWLEKERRHDELSPNKNGIQIALATNQITGDIKVEVSVDQSRSYIVCCKYTSRNRSAFAIATNKKIVSSHVFGWGAIDTWCNMEGGNKVLRGTLSFKFWPNLFKCECGIEQSYESDDTRPHWTIEKDVEYTSADLTGLYMGADAGVGATEYRIVL
jgi:hypothetical protein